MSRLKTFIGVFCLWTLVGVMSKLAFIALYASRLGNADIGELLLVLWHGLRLDVAVAAYLTAIPGLLLILSFWSRRPFLSVLWRAYFVIAALACSLAYIANLGLYAYWEFPLDDTPLLYIRTSPADAMASMEWWQLALSSLSVIALTAVLSTPRFPACQSSSGSGARFQACQSGSATPPRLEPFLLLLLEVSLLLPVRGGLGTGTNHTGSVYFSANIRLNHAAVNPVFSFVEAVVHHQDIGTKYRFMPDEDADRLFAAMTYTRSRSLPSSPDSPSSTPRPNVVLIVLESFSDTVMHVPGVTPRLLQLTSEGLYFTNFYASSFRTDRALVSIHSALPAQPTMSLMDIPRKSTSLPSIASVLARNGYTTAFYYGGDVNYSNMRSYFMGTGFHKLVSEDDFTISLRTGKWGVADGPVYDRMLADIKAHDNRTPFFVSIMTESSHEPFDVPEQSPDSNIAADKVLNAFAYADRCLGRFVDALKAMPCWENTLVAIVPDHLGAFPDEVDNYQLWRYRQPLVIIGGALRSIPLCPPPASASGDTYSGPAPMRLPVVGSQTDIAATLLAMIGIDHSEFTYSKDLLDPLAPHFAFFSFPDAIGLVTDSSSVVYDNTSATLQAEQGPHTDSLLLKAKAYLQKLYDDLQDL